MMPLNSCSIRGINQSLIFVEQFKVILLNAGNRVLGICTLTTGTGTNTMTDPKLIFAVAIKSNAVSIILPHNHPSGNLFPSQADIEIRQKIKMGGGFLDINVVDHIIVTSEGFYSWQMK
jgi:DNA repair protein RadC